MRALKFLAILIAAAIIFISARAYQQPGSYNTNGSGAPSGSCVSGSHYVDSSTGFSWTCSGSIWIGPMRGYLSGTTGSIGGSLLLAGGCTSGTASIAGATPGMAVEESPSDGTNIPGLGISVSGVVTSSGTVTVNLCGLLSVTPTAKTYNVRVFP